MKKLGLLLLCTSFVFVMNAQEVEFSDQVIDYLDELAGNEYGAILDRSEVIDNVESIFNDTVYSISESDTFRINPKNSTLTLDDLIAINEAFHIFKEDILQEFVTEINTGNNETIILKLRNLLIHEDNNKIWGLGVEQYVIIIE